MALVDIYLNGILFFFILSLITGSNLADSGTIAVVWPLVFIAIFKVFVDIFKCKDLSE